MASCDWRSTLITLSNWLKGSVHLWHWFCLYFRLILPVSVREHLCQPLFFYSAALCAYRFSHCICHRQGFSVTVRQKGILLNLLSAAWRMMLWGETVELNWCGGMTQTRQNASCCVSGLWNLKVARGRRRVKLWYRSSTWGLCLCAWLTSQLLVEEMATCSTEKLVWSIFHRQAGNSVSLFTIYLDLNKGQGERSHNRQRFVFVLSFILDFDPISAFLYHPLIKMCAWVLSSPTIPFLFCTAE